MPDVHVYNMCTQVTLYSCCCCNNVVYYNIHCTTYVFGVYSWDNGYVLWCKSYPSILLGSVPIRLLCPYLVTAAGLDVDDVQLFKQLKGKGWRRKSRMNWARKLHPLLHTNKVTAVLLDTRIVGRRFISIDLCTCMWIVLYLMNYSWITTYAWSADRRWCMMNTESHM